MCLDSDPRPGRRSSARSRSRSAWTMAEAAEGMGRNIDVKMEEAIKAISTMRGHDLRGATSCCSLSAALGPVHAGRIARELGMAGTSVPLYPVFTRRSGLIMSDVKHDTGPRAWCLSELTPQDVNAKARSARSGSNGCSCTRTGFGQKLKSASSALDSCATPDKGYGDPPCRSGDEPLRGGGLAVTPRSFTSTSPHSTSPCSGTTRLDEPGRDRCPISRAASAWSRRSNAESSSRPARRSRTRALRGRHAACAWTASFIDCPVYQREKSMSGLTLTGPAILDQFDCTTK